MIHPSSRLAAIFVVGCFSIGSAWSQDALVDLELSLVTDISGSVSPSEYALMMGGYAAAFEDPTLHQAISSGATGAIAVGLVFFDNIATEGLPFTRIGSADDSNAFGSAIRGLVRPRSGGTNVGAGIIFGGDSFATNGFQSPRQVIDVAGDGSGGVSPATRDQVLAGETDTINAIAIDDQSGNLRQTFEDELIGGPNAFAVNADTFEDFTPAILQKLLQEISGAVGNAAGPLAAARQVGLNAHLAATRDLNSRLFRLRANRRAPEPARRPIAVSPGKEAKGAKAGPVFETAPVQRYEVFGSMFYERVSGDRQQGVFAGTNLVTLPDFDADIWGGNVGLEYRICPAWTVGGALFASRSDTNIDGGSSLDGDRVGLAVYASHYRENAIGNADFYVDGLYSISRGDLDVRRGAAFGNTDSDFYSLDLNTGLNYQSGVWTHGPMGRVVWTHGTIDAYTDSSATSFPETDIDSLRTQLGYQVSRPLQTTLGPLVWQFRAAWEHEFENDQVNVAGLALGAPDDNYAVLGTGFLWQFSPSWRAVLDYEGRFSSDFTNHGILARVGCSF